MGLERKTDLVAGDAERPRLRDRLAGGLRRAASFLAEESRSAIEAPRTTDSSRAEEALYESEHRVTTCPPYARSTLAIQGKKGSLDRRIFMSTLANHPNGRVVCACDGTSMAVRACLANISAPAELQTEESPKPNSMHQRLVETCASFGLERVNKSFYPMGEPED